MKKLIFMEPREGWLAEGKMSKIKTRSTTFSCLRSLWRRDYLEHIKIVMGQAPLSLWLTHNEIKHKSIERDEERD
ncbi:unnamed protein product [Spirodela intermedia]|uniref:Uncharacterized protein n=1 Tax=Spirodela intermedia TaxID=51605 RepID=A0A7I8IU08_SPIIN|nr:unnamed protein product [Spirodela intermedia]CAA6661445.1 unnamed protein product [Spirodela intermedia]